MLVAAVALAFLFRSIAGFQPDSPPPGPRRESESRHRPSRLRGGRRARTGRLPRAVLVRPPVTFTWPRRGSRCRRVAEMSAARGGPLGRRAGRPGRLGDPAGRGTPGPPGPHAAESPGARFCEVTGRLRSRRSRPGLDLADAARPRPVPHGPDPDPRARRRSGCSDPDAARPADDARTARLALARPRGPRAGHRPLPTHHDGRLRRRRDRPVAGDLRALRPEAPAGPGLPGLRRAGAGDRRRSSTWRSAPSRSRRSGAGRPSTGSTRPGSTRWPTSGSRATSGRSPRGRSSSRASRCSGSTAPLAAGPARRDDPARVARAIRRWSPPRPPGSSRRRRAGRWSTSGPGGGTGRRRGSSTPGRRTSPGSPGPATSRRPGGWASRPSGRWPTPGSRRSATRPRRSQTFARLFPEADDPAGRHLRHRPGGPPRRRDRAADPGDPDRQRRPRRRPRSRPARSSTALGRAGVKILASNDLDECEDRRACSRAGAPIDAFGVGTELITSRDAPAISMVYKLVELDGVGRIKRSPGKKTYPLAKQVHPVTGRRRPVRLRPGHQGRRDRRGRAAPGPGHPRGPARRRAPDARRDPRPLPDARSRPCRTRSEGSTPRPSYPLEYSDALEAEAGRLGLRPWSSYPGGEAIATDPPRRHRPRRIHRPDFGRRGPGTTRRADGPRGLLGPVMEVIDREQATPRTRPRLAARHRGGRLRGLLARDRPTWSTSPVNRIDPNPFQPRRHFDPAEIAALADSIRQHGMLQPIIVRAVGDRYQLIAGERRLRASVEAQLHEIPARVMVLDDRRVSELAMVENLQREDLNAIEKADGLPRLPPPLRRDPGGAGRPARARPLDPLEPDPAPGTPRGGPVGRPVQGRSPRATPGPCSACPTPSRSSPPAAGSSPRASQSARPRPWSPPASRPPPAARIRKDAAEPGSTPRAGYPTSSSWRSTSRSGSAPPSLVRPKARDRGQIVIDYNSQEEYERVTSLLRGD